MDIKIVQENRTIRVAIVGSVDNDIAEDLKLQLQELLAHDFDEAIFDLTFVPFITSSGIGKFLIFYKNTIAAGRKMRVAGINDNLLELFKSIKLDQLFPIES